jgi:hypothetical protein
MGRYRGSLLRQWGGDLLLVAVALASLLAICALSTSPAHAQVVRTLPYTGTTADKSGSVTTGGTAQTAIAANTGRVAWCIQNDPLGTEVLYVRVGATATATTGVALNPGSQVCSSPSSVDTALVSVLGATTGHKWYGQEVQ